MSQRGLWSKNRYSSQFCFLVKEWFFDSLLEMKYDNVQHKFTDRNQSQKTTIQWNENEYILLICIGKTFKNVQVKGWNRNMLFSYEQNRTPFLAFLPLHTY